jgi:hypothetical protein
MAMENDAVVMSILAAGALNALVNSGTEIRNQDERSAAIKAVAEMVKELELALFPKAKR